MSSPDLPVTGPVRASFDPAASLSETLHLVGVMALWDAKFSGRLTMLNSLRETFPSDLCARWGIADWDGYVRWLENHGRVVWVPEKGCFMHAREGSWRLCAAARDPWPGCPCDGEVEVDPRADEAPGVAVDGAEGFAARRAPQEIPEGEQIGAYRKAHPEPTAVGPLGVPQAKYRHGTYGRRSMELDLWRRHVKDR